MENYDHSVEINHNPNWPYISDHPYRILIIAGSTSSKTNVLLNLIKNQLPDIDKICTSKIYQKQIINYLLTKEKMPELKKLKIQKHSLIYLIFYL